jgi:hypothetical protein
LVAQWALVLNPNDKYVVEPTATRANYQLEPGVVSLVPDTDLSKMPLPILDKRCCEFSRWQRLAAQIDFTQANITPGIRLLILMHL